jgi:RNA polymerase sigma-70 factor, ECF subfamily
MSSDPPRTPSIDFADADMAQLERHRDRLRLLAARRLRNWTDAEDVAQEALRRCLEALRAGRVEKTASLPAFLFQTVVHICQHRSLSAGREARAMQRFASGGPPPAAEPTDALETLITAERREAVHGALDRLDAEDREVLSLSYLETMDASEIGRRLGLTPGNVRVRRHRALRRLAELLSVTSGPDQGLKK